MLKLCGQCSSSHGLAYECGYGCGMCHLTIC